MFVYNPLFSPKIVEDAIAHARGEFPRESVGVITEGKYKPVFNASSEPETTWLINEEDFYVRSITGKIEAIIHSHNNSPQASIIDQQKQVEFEVPFGIINVINGELITHVIFWGHGVPVAPPVGRAFFFGVHDCLTLVRDYYASLGVDLPNPARSINFNEVGERMFEEYLDKVPFKVVSAVKDLEINDILFYSWNGQIGHIGVYIGEDKVLAHWQNQLSGYHDLSYKSKYLSSAMRLK
jgi:hypothetical protein